MSILILGEIPDHCRDCVLIADTEEWSDFCVALGEPVNADDRRDLKCPLKELPERQDTISRIKLAKEAEENRVNVELQAGFNLGWNACLDVILGAKSHDA